MADRGRTWDALQLAPAVRGLLAAGDLAAAAGLLAAHGEAIVAAGGAELVVAAVPDLPPRYRDDRVRMVYGEALALVGDLDGALAALSALAGDAGPVPPALAWRLGAVHYQRGDRDAALAALARATPGPGRTRDEALLAAQTATVHWQAGAAGECREWAQRALRAADAAGDHRAIAAAQVALALHAALTGDRAGNAARYARAWRHAELGADAVQVARIHANRAARLLEEARFPEAREAGARAVAAAAQAGPAATLALALTNQGEALTRLGELADAEASLQRAISIYQRTGSRKVAYPLTGLGDLHTARGAWDLARAAYEEAVRVVGADGPTQGVVPPLAGLARALAHRDPPAARELAARATGRATGPYRTRALLAAGWVALAGGDAGAAGAAAEEAAGVARGHRDRAGLAEALELQAFAAEAAGTAAAAGALREAARTWNGTGATLDADRVAVRLGRSPGAAPAERLAGRLAAGRVEAAGAVLPEPPGSPAAPAPVVIRTLGRFEVEVAGRPVPAAGWQSRKARDLLRILVARRGRTVPREELCALLWDGDDPKKVAHRLSVALSTLRAVCDPDRHAPADHYLVAGSGGIRLDVGHVTVDLESFLAAADLGLRLAARGDPAEAYPTEAYPALVAAAQEYAGDFCEDEPYQDWTVPTREEARAAYLRVLRALADLAGRRGLVDEAIGHLLRILRLDRYDEPGHRALVARLTEAGRHGEAHRARERYRAAMAELGLPVNASADEAAALPPGPAGPRARLSA